MPCAPTAHVWRLVGWGGPQQRPTPQLGLSRAFAWGPASCPRSG
jgi:hypothetical protein